MALRRGILKRESNQDAGKNQYWLLEISWAGRNSLRLRHLATLSAQANGLKAACTGENIKAEEGFLED